LLAIFEVNFALAIASGVFLEMNHISLFSIGLWGDNMHVCDKPKMYKKLYGALHNYVGGNVSNHVANATYAPPN